MWTVERCIVVWNCGELDGRVSVGQRGWGAIPRGAIMSGTPKDRFESQNQFSNSSLTVEVNSGLKLSQPGQNLNFCRFGNSFS